MHNIITLIEQREIKKNLLNEPEFIIYFNN